MAGEITNLSLLGAPLGPLEMEVVDTGDNTFSSNGTNRKVVAAGPFLIEEQTVAGGEFDFTIPSGFNHVYMQGSIDSSRVTLTAQGIIVVFNALTTATNYHRQNNAGQDNAANVNESHSNVVGNVTGAGAITNSVGQIRIDFPNYLSSNLKCAISRFHLLESTGVVFTGSTCCFHETSTAALTRIRIIDLDSPTYTLTGTLRLYGMF